MFISIRKTKTKYLSLWRYKGIVTLSCCPCNFLHYYFFTSLFLDIYIYISINTQQSNVHNIQCNIVTLSLVVFFSKKGRIRTRKHSNYFTLLETIYKLHAAFNSLRGTKHDSPMYYVELYSIIQIFKIWRGLVHYYILVRFFLPTTISNVPYERAIIDVLLHARCSYCIVTSCVRTIFRVYLYILCII